MFNNSDSFSVSGGAHNIVYGNQLNYHVKLPRNQLRLGSGERSQKKDIFREYDRVSTGNLRLIETFSEVKSYSYGASVDGMCWSDGTVRAKRAVHLACIVIGTQETQPSLAITYTGRDAKKVFLEDFLRFSRINFNDSDIPMIVFHDELIPAKQVIEGAQNSIEIRCYLNVQGNIAQLNLLSSADSISLDPIKFERANSSQIWIRPQTGQICLGPDGPSHHRWFFLWNTAPRDSLDSELPPLPLSMYNNLTFLDPVVKNTPSKFVLDTLSHEYTSTYSDFIADYNCYHNVRLSSRRQPVARFTRIRWFCGFNCYYHDPWYTKEPQRITMEDGRIRRCWPRLTISNHRIPDSIYHFFSTKSLCNAWLSQAAHVFNILGTPREEWEDYVLMDNHIFLQLNSDIDHTYTPFDWSQCVDTQINAPECFFFVLPPPQLPDMSPDLAAWRRAPAESLYYWSLDPTGDSRMPKVQRTALGLPSFHQTIELPYPVCWKAKVYDLARQWQEAQGFDPTTMDFARSIGEPILEILPQDDNRFENCAEDDKLSMLVDSKNEFGLERMEVDACFEIGSSSQGALLPQGQCEESSSMDVDMEDCSDLMADLRVGASLMDE
ncbi:hypothetical protein PQX77_012272 [Marasmius sp. AFHP31]|nr:hypothetical protein PQX77_012272 [Marasmius sp. AFHP31]